MVLNLPSLLVFGLSVSAAYILYKNIRPSVGTPSRSKSSKSKKNKGDSEFIASIVEKRERTARDADSRLNKLKSVGAEVDDDYEDLPDSDDDRKARSVGSGRRNSHWANKLRTMRKQAASKRRMEALNKEREKRMGSEAESSIEANTES